MRARWRLLAEVMVADSTEDCRFWISGCDVDDKESYDESPKEAS